MAQAKIVISQLAQKLQMGQPQSIEEMAPQVPSFGPVGVSTTGSLRQKVFK